MHELAAWEIRIADHVRATGGGDAAHDVSHIERVVGNAKRLGTREQANLAVVLPAAWLHDVVAVREDSPDRSSASALAALDRPSPVARDGGTGVHNVDAPAALKVNLIG